MTGNFSLNNNEISKERLVNKFITMLDSQGRLAPMDKKASPVPSYSKVTQRRWFGDIGCQLYRNTRGNQALKFFKDRHSEPVEEVTPVK